MSIIFNPIRGKVGDAIESVMNSPCIPEEESIQFKIRLCAEEILENVARYAYPEDVDGFVEIDTSNDGEFFYIIIKDGGIKFDPLAVPDPDVTLSADERSIGGLGIFLCKQMMDDVSYKYEDGCNIFTMKIKN